MKAYSTKSDIFNWSVNRSQLREVLRLRGGTGSPSPSPPPTRPSSPTQGAAGSSSQAVSTVRPALAVRSRSNLRRTEDISPVRRHTAPVRATDMPRSRRESFVETSEPSSEQVTPVVEKSKFNCSNCDKGFNTDRGRLTHEKFHCPQRIQVNIIYHNHNFIR